MAVPEHLRISALGHFGTPEQGEFFSYGFNMAQFDPAFLNTWFNQIESIDMQDLADSVRDFHVRAGSRIAAAAVLDTVKIARIHQDPANPNRGIYADDPRIFEYDAPGNAVGSANQPIQTALVVSLTTERRGPTGKGRFYIPLPFTPWVMADGFKISVADAEAVRNSAQLMINDANNQPGLDFGDIAVAVISSKGYATRVSGVRVGRIHDTMRSRRRSLGEAYTAIVATS